MEKATYLLKRIIPAFIMLQTLSFKFTAAPESIVLFTELGAEPYEILALELLN